MRSTLDAREGPVTPRRRRWTVWAAGGGLVLLVLLVAGGWFVDQHWPYRYRNVKPLLEGVFASKITIEHYHRTYFPHPGFVATGLTLRRNSAPELPPVGSTRTLIVQGSWMDMLTLQHRVRLVDVEGLHVVIPPVGSEANHDDFPPGSSSDFAGPSTLVDAFVIRDARLDILRDNGGRYSFPIKELVIGNLKSGRAISYRVDMQNAQPTGRILAHGSFGPLTPKDLGATPVSGQFTFSPVNLGEVGSLHGTLSAKGTFSGSIHAIEADATTDTPDFAVGKGTPTKVLGAVHAAVNGLNGNILLQHVELKTGASVLTAQGSLIGGPKVTEIDFAVTKGRAEDLLRPFLHERPPITGVVWVKAHAHVDPATGGEKFLQRLKVDGGFNVPSERLTDRSTEQSLSAFSQRAQEVTDAKEDAAPANAPDVLSSIEGQVAIRKGVMTTQRLTFVVPGAVAMLNGSYDLHTDAVHLVGDLKMQSDVSHVTTGFKSFLLKPFSPFFKKKKAGAVVPIAITGLPHHYTVSQNLLHEK